MSLPYIECGVDLPFFLEYVREDRTRPGAAGACSAGRFEEAVPVRSFHWAKGAAHFPRAVVVVDHVGPMWGSSPGWNVADEPLTVREIWTTVTDEHDSDASYAAIRDYIRTRRLAGQPEPPPGQIRARR